MDVNMNLTKTSPVVFDVRVLNDDGNKLAHLIPYCNEHQQKAEKLQQSFYSENPSAYLTSSVSQVIFTSMMELMKIQNIVKDRIVDIHYKMGLADKYKIVVAFDADQLPQAIGILRLDREAINGSRCIELYSIITAIWNINIPQNDNHPNRVKGAGSSIIEFCKKFAKESQAKYVYLEAAPTAESFYKKHGFSRQSSVESQATELTTRHPMVFDLEKV